MKTVKQTILPILLATIWISISEFARNEFLLKSYWKDHYQSLGLVFPSEPINGAAWGLWSLCFAIWNPSFCHTVYKSRIIKTLKNRPIDLLVPNMGAAKQGSWIMTLTLNAEMLKKLISKLNPNRVIPVHYGTFEHYIEPVENIKEINDNRITIVEVGSKTEVKIQE